MTIHEQFDAILALPIGGAIIAFGLGFFALFFAVARHVIERSAERRARLFDMADRMPGQRSGEAS